MNLKNLIEEFMDLVAVDKVDIYNEFSLQHELGKFLRENVNFLNFLHLKK